jgi:hypothetical protein
MTMYYLDPTKESDRWSLPDLEIFWADSLLADEDDLRIRFDCKENPIYRPVGFYFWFCYPGCLPDSDAYGPFASEKEALENAREVFGD